MKACSCFPTRSADFARLRRRALLGAGLCAADREERGRDRVEVLSVRFHERDELRLVLAEVHGPDKHRGVAPHERRVRVRILHVVDRNVERARLERRTDPLGHLARVPLLRCVEHSDSLHGDLRRFALQLLGRMNSASTTQPARGLR